MSADAYLHLAQIAGCLWVCGACKSEAIKLIKAKSTADTPVSLSDPNFQVLLAKSIEQCLPTLVEKVMQDKVIDVLNIPASAPHVITEHLPPSLSIRFQGIPEHTDKDNYLKADSDEILKILTFLGEDMSSVNSVRRLGKFKADATFPRTVVVSFTNSWTRRKILSLSHKLKHFEYKLFLSPMLSKDEREIEKGLLAKRRTMIEEGYLRKDLQIKNLKLLHQGKAVSVD